MSRLKNKIYKILVLNIIFLIVVNLFVLSNNTVNAATSAEDWMGNIYDGISLGDLSIPGTHDTGTGHYKGKKIGIQTQDMKLNEQLNIGVRFIDIRCGVVGDKLEIAHGNPDGFGALCNVNFDKILGQLNEFLNNHPSEAIIMSVKKEFGDDDIASLFKTQIDKEKYADLFYKYSDIPKLGAARGKVVLIKRFINGPDWGIDASTTWDDNKYHKIIQNANNKIVHQDHYNLGVDVGLKIFIDPFTQFPSFSFENENLTSKWNSIVNIFDEAHSNYQKHVSKNASDTLYLNFTSGYTIAGDLIHNNGINDSLIRSFKNKAGYGGCGVVIMDYINQELSNLVIATNSNSIPVTGTWRPQSQVTITSNWHFGQTINIDQNGMKISAQSAIIVTKSSTATYTQPAIIVNNRSSNYLPIKGYAFLYNSGSRVSLYDFKPSSIAPNSYSVGFGQTKTYTSTPKLLTARTGFTINDPMGNWVVTEPADASFAP
jgi:1-phosphatidylinositol phosphodiesterase